MDKVMIEIITINLVKDKINILIKTNLMGKQGRAKTITKKIIMEII
jgi:hypothetical protein